MGFAYIGPDGPPGLWRVDDIESNAYRAASPVTHVTGDDAPTLLLHGDADVLVPIHQSELMVAALQQANVPVKLVRVPGGKHGPRFQFPVGDPRLTSYYAEAVKWFDRHLRDLPVQ
jgi:dipeptidyl aminopeptidase/acylaminoacyl peptidase